MFVIPESIAAFFSLDFVSTLVGLGGAAVLPLLGFAHSCGDDCQCGEDAGYDLDACKNRIAELEKISVRSLEQSEELSDLYVDLASIAFEEGDELDEVVGLFDRSGEVLKAALAQGEDTEIRRRLGNVYLHRAVALNDYDELEEALESYESAIATLKPLEDKGDGEAKYDIAGIRLNRGTIYHEIGELEKARIDLDESFMAFRAVEKISDLDTRYYMAKVSIAQGSLLRDLDEPLDKVVDAYNRAMRLLVELIDLGQMEHERELANTLMDRCSASYEVYKEQEFESEEDREKKIGDVLIDVGRAIEILEKLVAESEGQLEPRIDLFNAVATQGGMILDLERFEEAKAIFDRALDAFADFAEDTDPVLLNQFAAACENRGFCLMNLGDFEGAIADFNESIRICERIQTEDLGLEDDEKKIFQPTLATYYANRANAYSSLGNTAEAQKDCRHGLDMIRSLKEELGDDIVEIEQLFENLLEQWK